jgi:hypothetical protein
MNAFGNQVAVGASRAADKLVALVERAVLEDDESGTKTGTGAPPPPPSPPGS